MHSTLLYQLVAYYNACERIFEGNLVSWLLIEKEWHETSIDVLLSKNQAPCEYCTYVSK